MRHAHAQHADELKRQGQSYHYQVCGPHMERFQPGKTTIRPSSPHAQLAHTPHPPPPPVPTGPTTGRPRSLSLRPPSQASGRLDRLGCLRSRADAAAPAAHAFPSYYPSAHDFPRYHPCRHDFPWNRLDQIVCGWDWQLDKGLRLRCKRFALLDYEAKQEDGLRRHVR